MLLPCAGSRRGGGESSLASLPPAREKERQKYWDHVPGWEVEKRFWGKFSLALSHIALPPLATASGSSQTFPVECLLLPWQKHRPLSLKCSVIFGRLTEFCGVGGNSDFQHFSTLLNPNGMTWDKEKAHL